MPKAPTAAKAAPKTATPSPTSQSGPKPPKADKIASNVPAILVTVAQAVTLSLDDLIAGIRKADSAYRGAFASFGVYRFFTERKLEEAKSKVAITTFLREKCGLSASTISHTAYAAKTFTWVMTKHITEEEYNALTARDMIAFVQVMGENSKLRMKPADAVALLKKTVASGGDVGEELGTIYEHGCTRAELQKRAEAEAKQGRIDGHIKDGRAFLGDRKFKDAEAAAHKALAEDKDNAEAKRLLEDIATARKPAPAVQNAAGPGAPTNPGVTPAPAVPIAPNGIGKPVAVGTPAPGVPTNITQMPKADDKPDGTTLGKMLDGVLAAVSRADAATQWAFLNGPWTAADALLKATVKKPSGKSAPAPQAKPTKKAA